MNLAKPCIDIGLSTNQLAPMLAFWQEEVGAVFDHVLPIRRGQVQHRHDVKGSVLKINHHAEPLTPAGPSGYRELIIARPGLDTPRRLTDPDGNLVTLAPPGWRGISQIGVQLAVRDLAAHRAFYGVALALPEARAAEGAAFAAGESLILLAPSADAPADAGMAGPGWRYITFQVFKVDEEHQAVLRAGGREALAPVTLGSTARISMVRDPDGNWIELSQRASITGSLD